jgi:deoxyribodipyrimidine photo-lyase
MLQIVWFKKDLRLHDHAPLLEAAQAGPVLPIYVYEPDILASPDYAAQHHQFINECLTEMAFDLFRLGSPLVILKGEMTQVLAQLKFANGAFRLLSHFETGNAAARARDQRVETWCKGADIEWRQWPRDGLVRGATDESSWTHHWQAHMRAPILAHPAQLKKPIRTLPSVGVQTARALGVPGEDKPDRQKGGLKRARQRLQEFFEQGMREYRHALSSAAASAQACSRLGPYLTYGVLSAREVLHTVWRMREMLSGCDPAQLGEGVLTSLTSFESRLYWRDHFVQRLEDEPELEFHSLNPAFDAIRREENREFIERWQAGETGFPLVDASLAMLRQTGWINFRLRALLVSFWSHHLWQPWREVALFLARETLDFEPGIHYPQVQLHSGVSGGELIRIYDPITQSRAQDRQGDFLRQWLPPLRRVSTEFIHEPWRAPTPPLGYSAPMVDLVETANHARETLLAARHGDLVQLEMRRRLQRFNTPAPAEPRTAVKPRAPQVRVNL